MQKDNGIQAIRLDRFPIHDKARETVRLVPYLDITAKDQPIDFLFTLGGKNGLIARANLHTLQGTKKAGKSAAGLALIVAALKGGFIGITPSRSDLSVLWIDTEQDTNTLRQKAKAVLSMAELATPPERLKVVSLRGCGGPEDALCLTLQAIEENKPDFVFLVPAEYDRMLLVVVNRGPVTAKAEQAFAKNAGSANFTFAFGSSASNVASSVASKPKKTNTTKSKTSNKNKAANSNKSPYWFAGRPAADAGGRQC